MPRLGTPMQQCLPSQGCTAVQVVPGWRRGSPPEAAAPRGEEGIHCLPQPAQQVAGAAGQRLQLLSRFDGRAGHRST